MTTGVIIARMQVDALHDGHCFLIEKSLKERDTTVVFLGEPLIGFTDINPIPFHFRYSMIRRKYPNVVVKMLLDNPDNDVMWSHDLDRALSQFKNVRIYCSRDSFKPHYYGVHKVVECKPVPAPSGTTVREKIRGILSIPEKHAEGFRKGIIHATQNRFPTMYSTVDIALLKMTDIFPNEETLKILLGRKSGMVKWVFPGGFVDPKDETLESAAARELKEEVTGINTHELTYVCSAKIDDARYKGTRDGIMTTLFKTYIMSGTPKAGDDLDEVFWFNLAEAGDVIHKHHAHLLTKLLKNLKVGVYDDKT